ncbi:dehydrogenase [Catellatospora sp. TT07R-123]|uniref:SDR family oxidoreductase n=1 Tax=Catellatospora sp. TT07R-123 TaxID=2733863 RepID=UPI001B0538AD|nr:SDR family oxidoreductase [Catellatospora sp. TT07R-123]GHJ48760.1 dehydrogenase [Catellatospora sp. TT07R-123]
MRVAGSTVVITGATGGIGAALARRFATEGATGLCLSDRPGTPLDALAAELSAAGVPTITVEADVADEQQVTALVEAAERELGRIDLFCANAGIGTGAGLDADPAVWAAAWSVNVMAHVHSARAVLPGMLARGHGWLLHTCSAAGLLSSPGDAPYAVTKHAAVAFAEWLSIEYGDRGIGVSVLCPQGVRTPLLTDGLAAGSPAALAVARAGTILEPEEVADATVTALAEGRFHILPHPEVAEYLRRKATDPDRWLSAMRRLR